MLDKLLEHTYFHNSVASWGAALATLAGVVAAIAIAQRSIVHRLHDTAHKTPALWDDVLLSLAHRTLTLFSLAMGIFAAASLLDLPSSWEPRLQNAVLVITISQGAWWATGLVRLAIDTAVDRGSDPNDVASRTGKNVLRFGVITFVWCLSALVGLEIVGFNVTSLVAGLGVTGVAVALATQNIVSDLFASVSLLLDKPFLAGDFIVCDAFMGTVERIGIRSTRLRSLGGEAIIMANSDLTKSRVRNYRNMFERRVLFIVAVPYSTPYEKLEIIPALLREAIEASANTRFDRAELLYMGESALQYEVVYHVLDRDYNLYTKIQQQVNLAIIRRLQERGIGIALRTQAVYNIPWEHMTAHAVPPAASN